VLLFAKEEVPKGQRFFSSSARGASQLWKDLLEAKSFCQRGMKYILGNGKKIRFWHEVWLEDCHLRIKYEKLYNIYSHQHWEVSRVLRGRETNLTFRRKFENPESGMGRAGKRVRGQRAE
jgi:hypothetical protein